MREGNTNGATPSPIDADIRIRYKDDKKRAKRYELTPIEGGKNDARRNELAVIESEEEQGNRMTRCKP